MRPPVRNGHEITSVFKRTVAKHTTAVVYPVLALYLSHSEIWSLSLRFEVEPNSDS